jgi:hypothetical protein
MKHLILAAAALLTACSSATTIRVDDPDARIYIDNEYQGMGETRYADRKMAFTTLDVAVRKDGCEEQNYRIRRNERPDVGAIVFGYYLAVPMLWLSQYKEHHNYEFYCEQIVANE